VNPLSRKIGRIEESKLRLIQEQNRERGLIKKEIKTRGSLTIPELSEATGMQTDKVLNHIIAMMQSGQVMVVGEKGDYFMYDLTRRQ